MPHFQYFSPSIHEVPIDWAERFATAGFHTSFIGCRSQNLRGLPACRVQAIW